MSDDYRDSNRDWLLREFVGRLIDAHPLPWHCESDWTVEVIDAAGKLVLNCRLWSQAEELIRLVEQITVEREEARVELRKMGIDD